MAPRILVFGTGAIGSTYSWILSRQVPAQNIVCVCRSNFDVAKAHGLTINSTLWGNNLVVKPTVVRSVEEAANLSHENFDYIVVATKVLNTTPSIAELIKPALAADSAIVLIQNGIGIEEPFATLYPSNAIISTVVYLPATQTSPGVIEHKELELLHVGTYPSNAPVKHKSAAVAFTDLINSCRATAKFHEDVQFERWSKLLVNASWNPICALTRSRDAEFLKESPLVEPAMASYVHDVMTEIASIAQACGYTEINEDLTKFQIGRATARSVPGVEPSMLSDAKSMNRLEVDAIVGNALKIAESKNVSTPLLRGVYILLSALDGSFARAARHR